MLTSAARETLAGVETVIIDEIHAVAATKRGAHLAVSLERLDELLAQPAQRIGLSATVRPMEEMARFLGGRTPVTIVAPPIEKTFDLRVVVPVDDMTELGARATSETLDADEGALQSAGSIWPHVDAAIVDEVLKHRSTIVFANSRRLAERLTASLNELYEERLTGLPVVGFPAQAVGGSGITGAAQLVATASEVPLLARAHHGSVSKEQRAIIEDDLKSGRLRCVVATSSLELGIDMGAVDLVIQVESPPSVASGLQRVGRAGHQVGEISKGILFPKHRADLLHTTVASERMRDRPDRGAGRADQPARHPGAADRRRGRARHARRRELVGDRAPLGALRHPAALGVRGDARPAERPVPERRVRRAAAADRLGSRGRHDHGPTGRAAARRHQRRHDPRPRPLRRLHRRRRRGGAPGRRARRGDGLRVSRRRRLRPRRDQLAHRRDHQRPGAGQPGVRAARARAVLEGRRAGQAGRAGSGDRRVHERAGIRCRQAQRRDDRPHRSGRSRRTSGHQPGEVRRRAEAVDRRRSDRHHAAGRALPRRARRLAARAAFPVRHAGARAVGARRDRAHPRAPRRRGLGHGGRRRHRGAPARDGCRTARRRPLPLRSAGARRARDHRGRRAARCSRPASGSARLAPCCSRATTPAAGRRSGSSGSAARSCSRSRASTRAFRSSSRRCARCCRTSTTCPPWPS